MPARATLEAQDLALSLVYGDTAAITCRVQAKFDNDNTARLIYSVTSLTVPRAPITAHMPLLPHIGSAWKTASGKNGILNSTSLNLTADEAGGWFEHSGWRIDLPVGSSLVWPVAPHDPYKKDGRADLKDNRIVVALPFTDQRTQQVTIQITS